MKITNGFIPRSEATRGQVLLMLLIFMIIGITVTSAAIGVIITNSINAQKVQSGTVALQTAESGIENGLLRLLRNPFYTGDTININDGTATVAVVGTNPYTITSIGVSGNFQRKIQVEVNYNEKMTITSWKEL